jgi:hypothetical protein
VYHCAQILFEMGVSKSFLSKLASDHVLLDLSLTSSYDYKSEPLGMPGVMVNLACQLDWIKKCLED